MSTNGHYVAYALIVAELLGGGAWPLDLSSLAALTGGAIEVDDLEELARPIEDEPTRFLHFGPYRQLAVLRHSLDG